MWRARNGSAYDVYLYDLNGQKGGILGDCIDSEWAGKDEALGSCFTDRVSDTIIGEPNICLQYGFLFFGLVWFHPTYLAT